jgi:hypothetical protein
VAPPPAQAEKPKGGFLSRAFKAIKDIDNTKAASEPVESPPAKPANHAETRVEQAMRTLEEPTPLTPVAPPPESVNPVLEPEPAQPTAAQVAPEVKSAPATQPTPEPQPKPAEKPKGGFLSRAFKAIKDIDKPS